MNDKDRRRLAILLRHGWELADWLDDLPDDPIAVSHPKICGGFPFMVCNAWRYFKASPLGEVAVLVDEACDE